jgi:hypothetical protein
VGVGHADLIGPGLDQVGQVDQQGAKLLQYQVQPITQTESIGIVLYIHAGSAQVYDAASHRTLLGEGFDLGHQVMPGLGLDLVGTLDVHVLHVRPQVGHLLRRHQAVVGLGLGQGDPDTPPETPFVYHAPDPAHGVRAIAPGQR